jgi:hypothetical protein
MEKNDLVKLCKVCHIHKKITEFSKKTEKLLLNKCKPCQAKYSTEHYRKNKVKYLKRNNERGLSIKQEVDKLKDKPCLDCGNRFPPYVMDFDHLYNKKRNVSRMIYATASRKAILEEISKCELVCSNCHRIRTFSREQKRKINSILT